MAYDSKKSYRPVQHVAMEWDIAQKETEWDDGMLVMALGKPFLLPCGNTKDPGRLFCSLSTGPARWSLVKDACRVSRRLPQCAR